MTLYVEIQVKQETESGHDKQLQDKQFEGQTKHDPLYKYLPVTHVEQD
jgi:hypothetical protein